MADQEAPAADREAEAPVAPVVRAALDLDPVDLAGREAPVPDPVGLDPALALGPDRALRFLHPRELSSRMELPSLLPFSGS